MPPSQIERIYANCEIIWGKGPYNVHLETADLDTFRAVVRKGFGISPQPPLTMTGFCASMDHAWIELDYMLWLWVE
ncbi:hypothetical protein BO70DRAFT_362683 [Aspergillus heteromorphus CBS 117.55]|uniref:Uncharacterized protein n=1 Tax=Aspergillus heteromorphus CBS 117.55 TaxID=1448321 RepID=A0A317W2C6_9EURO|nr:uncharacterized protein BO70DRAFT_362683 [Aspergillus heteromorphus CBS 117.55]PWY80724.1 hypothetical protein BO70DRAFT_362683 [Aspergillus heteromorphus CBS 117.55]